MEKAWARAWLRGRLLEYLAHKRATVGNILLSDSLIADGILDAATAAGF